ncbi:MAG: DNA polymerase III subunit delta' C-terminal domain-containing protein, partial [Pseudomonadota bacterium]
IIRLKCAPEATNLFNAEQRDGLKEVAQRLNLTQLFGYLDVLIRAKSLLKSQVNKQLMLEELLIKWINLQHYSGRNSWQR